MKRAIKIAVVLVYILTMVQPLFALDTSQWRDLEDIVFTPSSRLVYPTSGIVNLSGKNYLEFKWNITDIVATTNYDFRLYKGYQTIASGLILKETLPHDASSIQVKANLFQDNQVYTWTLSRTAFGGRKSDKSFSSFKVIKK